MTELGEFLCGPFLWGSTVLLGAGALAALAIRAPIQQQRVCEWAVAAVAVWLALALCPLPRVLVGAAAPTDTTLAVAPTRARVLPTGVRPAATTQRVTLSPTARDAHGTASPIGSFPYVRGTPAAPDRTVTWQSALARAYALGMALALAWLLVGFLGLHRIVRRARQAPAWLRELVRSLAADARRPVRILVSARAARPFCCGLIRPKIVLPAALCESPDAASRARLRHVLLHELAHVEQGDLRGQLLFGLALPVLYAHPLYWWLRARAHLAAELVADDRAASHTDARSYAHELIHLAGRPAPGRMPSLAVMPAFRRRSEFYRRMKMLLQRDSRLSTRCTRAQRAVHTLCAATLIAGAASLWGTAPVRAQDPTEPVVVKPQEPSAAETKAELMKEIAALKKALLDAQVQIKTLEHDNPRPRLLARLLESTEAQKELARIFAQIEAASDEPSPLGITEFGLSAFADTDRDGLPDTRLSADGMLKHSIQTGDTLESIAAGYYGSSARWRRILEANPDLDPNLLRVGATLNVPLLPDAEPQPVARTKAVGQPVPVGAGQAGPMAVVDNGYVIDLATRAIDLRAELELAEDEFDLAKKLAAKSAVSKQELGQVRVKLGSLKRKYDVVRTMIGSEIQATQLELESLSAQIDQLADKKDPRRLALQGHLLRAKGRLETLQSAM